MSHEPLPVRVVEAPRAAAQLTPHRGQRVELAGSVVALRAEARARTPDEPWDAVAVLVPGYSGSKEDFAPLIDPVADAGIGVLALDLPGQFESPPLASESDHRASTLGAVVARIVADEADAGRTVLLLGHSFGGLVARAAVLAGAPVRGLTLMDTGPGELPMGPRRTRLDVLEPVLRRRGLDAVVALREEAGDWEAATPAVAAFLRQRLERSSPVALLGMGDALRSEPDRVPELVAALRGRRLATLVVCGMHDDAWPVTTQRTMADRLEAEFAAVPHAAHSPNVENPAALLDVLVPTWRTWLREDTLEP
ncbi:alpha/beta fold hydrolase [Actinomycetospora sp. NBRC 106378]|uniref:alpha/beta fold hydrolase n=1 Tax=Actinomycetospora sp. NBRC 106378 TaxID=3032208 RepID=UPI0024A35E58|nr:alpha/beta fold hydrolase [Actinomycetospora sp. NBRC 106378]GLZ54349.1 alpha/beta hydrolase [Actinomycetospora sp. NBRC 106378]